MVTAMVRGMARRGVTVLAVAGFVTLAAALTGVMSLTVGAADSSGRNPARGPSAQAHHPAAQAYGLVVPPCSGCGKLPKNFTPLRRSNSLNVSLGSSLTGAPLGTWCFRLTSGVSAQTATVVPSVVSVEGPRHRLGLEEVRWVVGAPNCPTDEIEIATFRLNLAEGPPAPIPTNEIAFSFVVD